MVKSPSKWSVQCSADKSSHSSTGNNSAFSEAIFNFQVCKLKRLKRRSCWYKVCQNRSSRSKMIIYRTEWLKNEIGKRRCSPRGDGKFLEKMGSLSGHGGGAFRVLPGAILSHVIPDKTSMNSESDYIFIIMIGWIFFEQYRFIMHHLRLMTG